MQDQQEGRRPYRGRRPSARRIRFLELLDAGMRPLEASRDVGVNERTGRDWAAGIVKSNNRRYTFDGVLVWSVPYRLVFVLTGGLCSTWPRPSERMRSVGFFGSYLFSGGEWGDWDPDVELPAGVEAPWISVEIHDSDFTTIRYKPHDPGTGVAYLGITPRIYFDGPKASAPTDAASEAAGLARWGTHRALGATDPLDETALCAYLADDEGPDDDDADEDDAEIFVELKTVKFLRLMGLALPSELAALDH